MARSSLPIGKSPEYFGSYQTVDLALLEREAGGAVDVMGLRPQHVRWLSQCDERPQATFHTGLCQIAPSFLGLQMQPQDVTLEAPDAGGVLVWVTVAHGLAGSQQQRDVGIGERQMATRHGAGEFGRQWIWIIGDDTPPLIGPRECDRRGLHRPFERSPEQPLTSYSPCCASNAAGVLHCAGCR